MPYALRVQSIDVINEAGDAAVELVSHLVDDLGVPFTTSSGALDQFIIRAPASDLPGSGFQTYLETLALEEIAKKYDASYPATAEHNSNILSLLETDVDRVFLDLQVDGPGLSAPATLISVLSATEIRLSSTVTREFTGDTTSPEIITTGDVTASDTVITNVGSTTGIESGMSITGTGVPFGAIVQSVDTATQITISQDIVTSGSGVTLTFTTNPETFFLDSVSPAILTSDFEGMTVTGAGIPTDTTIEEVISTSRLRLSQAATSTNAAATYTFSGSVPYAFDTSTLTIDVSTEIARVVSIIDFTAL